MRRLAGSLLVLTCVACSEAATPQADVETVAAEDLVDDATPYAAERRRMVRTQIAARGITDEATLRAMASVPRHEFVPAGYEDEAYGDHPLPIGHGQTISQPYIVASMTEELRLAPGDRVLEIGTGSGYQAAVAAEITPHVFSIEIVPELALRAAERLARLGYDSVRTRQGDGWHGWAGEGPFDAIVVTAAIAQVPPSLVAQLARGGRMVIPVGRPFAVQSLVLLTKDEDGAVSSESLYAVRFVPFTRSRETPVPAEGE